MGPVYLVIFCYWVGPVPYLELFGVGPVEKNTLYKVHHCLLSFHYPSFSSPFANFAPSTLWLNLCTRASSIILTRLTEWSVIMTTTTFNLFLLSLIPVLSLCAQSALLEETTSQSCSPDQFACHDGSKCIPKSDMCNGYCHCPDHSHNFATQCNNCVADHLFLCKKKMALTFVGM